MSGRPWLPPPPAKLGINGEAGWQAVSLCVFWPPEIGAQPCEDCRADGPGNATQGRAGTGESRQR